MKKESKKGVVLVYVILIFAVLTILGAGLLAITNHNTKMTKIEISSEQAYQSALSGLETTIVSFEKDAEAGSRIALKVRGGETPSTTLNLASQKMGTVNIRISCKLDPPIVTSVQECKKLEIKSTGTVDGLSRTVVGYVNIIEGGFDKPIVLNNTNGASTVRPNGNGQNSMYCLFDQAEGCAHLDKVTDDLLQKIEIDSENEVLANYKEFITDKINEMRQVCNPNQTITSSCSLKSNVSNLVIDNSKNDIYIDLTKLPVKSFKGTTISLTDVDSENVVVMLVDDFYFEDSKIGSEGSEDNILIMSRSTEDSSKSFDLHVISDIDDCFIRGWIVNPFGDITLQTPDQAKKYDVNIYGGLFSKNVFSGKFSSVYGFKPSSKIMGIISESGLVFTGGAGGAMTFVGTYDE